MELKNITLHDITHTGKIKDHRLSAELIELLEKGHKYNYDKPEPRHDIEDLEDDDIDHWGINLEDPESKIPAEIVPATIWYEQCESWDANQWMVVMWRCPKTRIHRMTALISDGHCYIYTVRIL